MLFLIAYNGYAANAIDSLKTKEDVQQFLTKKFGKEAFIWTRRCADLSQAEKNKLLLAEQDTIMVDDSMTGKTVVKIKPRVLSPNSCLFDDTDEMLNFPADHFIKIINKYHWHFYKADINADKRSDMLIAAGGITLAIIDNGTKFKGHILSFRDDLKTDVLKNIIRLPDGSAGLLFKWEQSNDSSDKLYDTDTIVYKFQGFAKYNNHYQPTTISKLSYRYVRSEGLVCDNEACIVITTDGKCFLRYDRYNTIFESTVDTQILNELFNLVRYSDVKSIPDKYVVQVDHGVGGTFTVYFGDGTKKSITIWGESPPKGVDYVLKNISDISRSVRWLKSNRTDFNCN